jgi:hypothetical protein
VHQLVQQAQAVSAQVCSPSHQTDRVVVARPSPLAGRAACFEKSECGSVPVNWEPCWLRRRGTDLLVLLALLAAKVAVVSPVPVRQPAPPARVPNERWTKTGLVSTATPLRPAALSPQSLRCRGNSTRQRLRHGLKLQSTTSRHTCQHERSNIRKQGGYALAFWFGRRGLWAAPASPVGAWPASAKPVDRQDQGIRPVVLPGPSAARLTCFPGICRPRERGLWPLYCESDGVPSQAALLFFFLLLLPRAPASGADS